jgi:multiple sugar transport system permease protein
MQVAASATGQRSTLPWYAGLVGASSPLQARKALWGYLFLMPWLIGLIVFWLGPILASFAFSFLQYDMISAPTFVGLANYRKALSGDDDLFWPSLLRTFQYSLVVVPLGLIGALGLAMLLNRGMRGSAVYRTFFFLPSLTPAVALALVWTWLMHSQVGPINVSLGWIGIDGPAWLTDKNWALWALIIITLWNAFGGNSMLIFLAGLQGVPDSLLDAAEIDGAGRWAKFRHVVLPMISPTLLFNLILGVINALKVFTIAYVATKGGPAYATWFLAYHIYQEAFQYFRMGYGSALAWIFVITLLVFTFLQMRLSKRFVYYAGEND